MCFRHIPIGNFQSVKDEWFIIQCQPWINKWPPPTSILELGLQLPDIIPPGPSGPSGPSGQRSARKSHVVLFDDFPAGPSFGDLKLVMIEHIRFQCRIYIYTYVY